MPYILFSIGILFVECIGVNFSPVVAYPQNHFCSGLPESLPMDVLDIVGLNRIFPEENGRAE